MILPSLSKNSCDFCGTLVSSLERVIKEQDRPFLDHMDITSNHVTSLSCEHSYHDAIYYATMKLGPLLEHMSYVLLRLAVSQSALP